MVISGLQKLLPLCPCILGEHAPCLLAELLKWGKTGPEKQGESQYRQRTAWLSEAEATSGRPEAGI